MYVAHHNVRDTAKMLGVSPLTLQKWRSEDKGLPERARKGPKFKKNGKIILYSALEIERWIDRKFKEY